MTPKQAEASLSQNTEDQRLYAVAALAPLTPGITYTPQPMYDTVLGHMSPLGVDADGVHDIVRMFVTAAADAVAAKTTEEMPGGRFTITGHTDHEVPTGDWQFDVDRQRFTVEPNPDTEAAVAALRDVDPGVLRKVLGRLIDQTTIGFVLSEGSTGLDVSGAMMIGASVLKGALNAEDRTKFTAALLRPGATEGDIIQITALRLTKPAEPEEERPEV